MKQASTPQEEDLSELIDVQFAVTCNSLDEASIRSWCDVALEDVTHGVCVRLVGSEESADLNSKYRTQNVATNVLAFESDIPNCLGDVVVCVDVASAEAIQQHKSLKSHVAHLVIHGTLHLRGFDHEDSTQASEMEAKEVSLLRSIGISNPYES